jgi:pimeloyl-ACP methyl ester carboxylesterase
MAPWLHEIRCPCLVLTGEFDGGCNPRLNEFIHGELPDSQLVILEGLKHALMIEASDRVLPHLREFLLQQGLD